uniref:Medium-chain acyl-CoA ligase ACSF2, mitochondrial n=1 Tax=Timema douglasi TaxID=61478 RepID=A0A7R8ZAH0_TIMDO|nr:unnamed protein product [Timema douglasi]
MPLVLWVQADRLAAGLLEIGLQPGDRLGLWSTNCSEWYITSFAAARAGLTLVNINPAYQSPELRYCINKVGLKALVMADTSKTQNFHQILSQVSPELGKARPGRLSSESVPSLKSVIVMTDQHLPGVFQYEDIMDAGSKESIIRLAELQDRIQSDQGCTIHFTSGTTGTPKAALLSHHTLVNNSYYIGKRMNLKHKVGSSSHWSRVINHCSARQHRICLPLPLFHVFGSVVGVLTAMQFGATLVLPSPSVSADFTLRAIQQEKVTVSIDSPLRVTVSIDSPLRVTVSIDSPLRVTVSIDSPLRVTVSIDSPLRVTVSIDSPLRVTVSIDSPLRVTVSIDSPLRVTVSIDSPLRVTVSIDSPLRVTVSIDSPLRVTVSIDSPLRVTVSIDSPLRVTVSIDSPLRVTVSIDSPLRVTVSIDSPLRVTVSIDSPLRVTVSIDSPLRVTVSIDSPLRVTVSIDSPLRVTVSIDSPLRVTVSIDSPLRVTVSIDSPLRVTVSIDSPLRVTSVFGMTETGPLTFQVLPDDPMDKVTKTVGCVSEHIEVGITAYIESCLYCGAMLGEAGRSRREHGPHGVPGRVAGAGILQHAGVLGGRRQNKEHIGERSLAQNRVSTIQGLQEDWWGEYYPGAAGVSTIQGLVGEYYPGTGGVSTIQGLVGEYYPGTGGVSTIQGLVGEYYPRTGGVSTIQGLGGDQFVLAEDGYGRIVGRLKEMIIRGGENIFPKEIEDFLQTHPDILEAQVFGVDDVRLGEVVACSLRLKEGSALTQEDIRAYCKGKIAHFKIPKYFKFVTEFSKTSSGKIQKFKLKEEITKELESQKSFGENNSLLSLTTGAGGNRK